MKTLTIKKKKRKRMTPKQVTDKPKTLPTPVEMQVCRDRFSDTEWFILCRHGKFLDAFAFDLEKAKILAEQILTKKS